MLISWAANIILHSSPSGLRVELTPVAVTPRFTKDKIKYSDAFMKVDHNTGTAHVDVGDAAERTCNLVFEEFEREFPSVVDLKKLVSSLSRGLEGCWNGLITESNEIAATKPFFNMNGDFLLDLCIKAPEPQGKKALNGGKNGVKGVCPTSKHCTCSMFRL